MGDVDLVKRKIAGLITYIYDRKTGMNGFKIGPNLTVKAYKRRSFDMAMRAAIDKKTIDKIREQYTFKGKRFIR